MRITMVGAGGVGAYYGGLLAQAGHDVTFVARGAHLAALQSHGLRVQSVHGDFQLAGVRAVDRPDGLPAQDLVVFCVKTYDMAGATAQVAALVGPQTLVLTLQNGLTTLADLEAAYGADRVVLGVCYIEVFIQEPGSICQRSAVRDVVLADPAGPGPRVEQLAATLQAAGIPVRVEADTRTLMWSKAILISSLGAVATVARQPTGPIRDCPDTLALLTAVLREHEAVALADGARVAGVAASALDLACRFAGENKPSMLRDLENGKPIEVEALQGAVVRAAERLGVAVPHTATLLAILRLLDRQARAAH